MNNNINLFKINLSPDDTEINISEDETILTASLRNDIQHLHACGGLGMCSTCRVEVLSGEDNLHPKSESEQALSDKLELPSNIRLACQTKVKGNVKLKRLLLDQKDLVLANQMTKNSVGSIGSTKRLALMFVDIVAFTPLSEQLPSYDVMYILNRYFDDMGTIVKKNGGDINNFVGDAFLAAFGIDDKIDSVYRCTQAALEILKDVDIKNDIYIIKSEISDNKSSASLYWKVIHTGSSFKIIDVIVENTSYFVTKKSEFNKILRKNRGSLEALIIEIGKI